MSYVDQVSPNKVQQAVTRGAKRLENFKRARVKFVSQYAGPWYDRDNATIGTNPINLIFNAIRVVVPTLVMAFPKHTVQTPYLQSREYANLLGLALDQQDLKLDICNIYRRAIVDALFTLGILKTGLAQSDNVYVFDDDMGQNSLDNGTIYTDCVDFDNFVVDPASKEHLFRDAAWMGDRLTVPRQMLLDSGLYRNDLIECIPRADNNTKSSDKASDVSMRAIDREENAAFMDDVEVYEIWVPSANAVVTVPACKDVHFDDYLRVADYYGVKEGPYSFLCLTPPVPGNPIPVPSVGIWYDIHILANQMAKKIVEQATRQKDIVTYKRSSVDDVEEIKNAGDGETVALDDIDGVKTLSFGGQQNSNENHLQSLENWFNQMAGNPAQVGGQNIEAHSATAANILQQNSGIGLEDMRDQVYKLAASEARKRAWFLHTDPMMKLPLIKRQPMQLPVPGAEWLLAPQMQDVQVILTPEARSGDFLDYTFTIEPESMGRVDSKMRLQQEMSFAQQILPAVMLAAQTAMAMGIPFDAQAFLLRMAKDAGITWMDEVLYSPAFQQQLMMQQLMGPQAQNSKGQPASGPGNPNLGPAMMQNGQPGQVMGNPQVGQNPNQEAQAGANDSQMLLRTAERSAFKPSPAPKTPSLI